MKSLLLSMCLVLCIISHTSAAKKSYSDFIVLNNNDTIYGKVLTSGGFKNVWVRVKPEDEPKQRYRMEDVKALRDRGRDFLRKDFIHIRWPLTAYLRVDIVGEISLLYMPCESSRVNYDLFAMLENGEVIPINTHNFYTRIWPLLKASPTFMAKAGNEEIYYPRYNRHYYKRIAKLIHWYNGTEPL